MEYAYRHLEYGRKSTDSYESFAILGDIINKIMCRISIKNIVRL